MGEALAAESPLSWVDKRTPRPTNFRLPSLAIDGDVLLPEVICKASRPSPALPRKQANGHPLPTQAFNPFDDKAPAGTWDTIAREVASNLAALFGIPVVPRMVAMLALECILCDMDMDEYMRAGGFYCFCIHSERDVLLCGLSEEGCAATFKQAARQRDAMHIIESATDMIEKVRAKAQVKAGTFKITDDYTTRFGYSTQQLGPISTCDSALFLARTIARGGAPALQFRNLVACDEETIGSSRAALREQMVEGGKRSSDYFRDVWVRARRPRVTSAFKRSCEWVQTPFTVEESVPLASETNQVQLATWETTLRGLEEHLMLTVFGAVPNITWARILAKVFEKAEEAMGEFNLNNYRWWACARWPGAHSVGPGQLGCPFKGGASRLLGKGACGIHPYKPMHDDKNGMISLSFWTTMTEPEAPTELVFVMNGFEVKVRVRALRWVLFMGYIPHESRPVAPDSHAATAPRLHHSAFNKPEAEHLATHILSNLPCRKGSGPWSFSSVHRLKAEAFLPENMQPVLSQLAKSAAERIG